MDHVNLSFKVLDAFYAAADVEEFIEATSVIIGNPMIVVGSGFKLLASSSTEGLEGADFWTDAVQNGAFSGKLIDEVLTDHCWDMHITTNEPYERDHTDGPYKWLISKLVFRGQLYGTVVILEVNPMPAGIWKLLPLISNLVVKLLFAQRENIIFIDNRSQETVFTDLLLGNEHPDSPFHNRVLSDKLGDAKYFQLLTVPIHDKIRENSGNLRHTFESLLRDCWVIFYEGHLQILRYFPSRPEDDLLKTDQLTDVLKAYGTVLCCSDIFMELTDLPRIYGQALRTLKILRLLGNNEVVISQSEYRFLDMVLSAVDYDPAALDGLLDSRIKEIRQYDKENGTDYFRTLCAYLQSKEICSAAAQRLFTHRNTILYRIGRIKELFHIDLDASDTWFRLLYSCAIAAYMDEISGCNTAGSGGGERESLKEK
ncbi:MAG: hypothetical protein E7224_04970 [Clostridiales bacterium]|nr:hypothetical protein [Clostridiales bacterium]